MKIKTVDIASLKKDLKPYNIAVDGDSAEITMYGEVVQDRPKDWWTGEKDEGLYIVLSEFLQDLDNVKFAKDITVRINSVGGDLWAGVSIYNRLKEMENVTTIVDGLAASAASIIAQAGKKRCVYESSQIMIHGASTLLYDYYNVQALNDVLKQLKSANETVVNVYVESTGQSEEKLKSMVDKTTWMTGSDAVELGFADEIISGKVDMRATADKHMVLCNGIPMNGRLFPVMPEGMKRFEAAPALNIDTKDPTKKEDVKMTLEDIKNQYPELVAQIADEAKHTISDSHADEIKAAVAAERARIKDIESIENQILDKELVEMAKYGDTPMDAKDLAFEAMKKERVQSANFLADMQKDVENSGALNVEAVASQPEVEDKEEDVEAKALAEALAFMKKEA